VDLTAKDSIRLSVPAASSAVRIARAGAAGLATRAGFTYREVEQLQLAVGEAAALLAPDAEGDGTLTLTFDVETDGMRIELHLTDPGLAGAGRRLREVPSVAEAVLDASVDSWRVAPGGRRVLLHKQRHDTDDDEHESV
jgi:anti-sigma regulatory factor (Ser/Thr protein kinase)